MKLGELVVVVLAAVEVVGVLVEASNARVSAVVVSTPPSGKPAQATTIKDDAVSTIQRPRICMVL
ncbi:MAG: hypothetical protein WD184_09815 [Acidimicrobiia bacterium]